MVINYKRPGMFGFGWNADTNKCAALLKPGVNEIEKAIWDKWKTHPIIAAMIEDGTFEVVSEKDEKPAKVLLSTKKTHEAIELAKHCIELEVLKEWMTLEKRPTVKKAIKEQIEALEAPIVYRDESGTISDKET